MGGWMATRVLSCSNGLGPGPLKPGAGLKTRNGLAGPISSPKKNRQVTNITSRAHPTSGSSRRLRNFWPTANVYPDRNSTHSRIEPSRADHIPATVNSSGVLVLPLSATNFTVKSWVNRACSMAKTDSTAAPMMSQV